MPCVRKKIPAGKRPKQPEILTCSGNCFSFSTPDTYHFEIEAIAHALSHLCRFTGHTAAFYSVAQHSVLVSSLLPPNLRLAGLLHDAAEAFTGDMTRPLKARFPAFRRMEKKIESAIYRQYGVPFPLPGEVKKADMALLATELRDLMPQKDFRQYCAKDIHPMKETIQPWEPATAKKQFLASFSKLTGCMPNAAATSSVRKPA